MTNGSTNNLITNNEARGNGDDAFALFSATDAGGGANTGNVFENLSRHGDLAGGRHRGLRRVQQHVPQPLHRRHADLLRSSRSARSTSATRSSGSGRSRRRSTTSRSSGRAAISGARRPSRAIWVFSASKEFRAIRVSNVDIVDPTYSGIMFQTKYVGHARRRTRCRTRSSRTSRSRVRRRAVTRSTPSPASASGSTSCPSRVRARRSARRRSTTCGSATTSRTSRTPRATFTITIN